MARVQFIIPDEDRDRFVHQATREGMTLSAWLRAAARERLAAQERRPPFESVADVDEFFRQCDEAEGVGTEHDWADHLRQIEASRRRGTSGT